MKKYISLGELLTDYRKLKNLSQGELAARLNVDTRTVIRWEKDITLVKSDKEEEMVEETFIPYQVIRNLNAAVTIPTYYDFRLRKYSLAEVSNELPDAEWLKTQIEKPTLRVRPIEMESDFQSILRYAQFQHKLKKPLSRSVLEAAIRNLPELNLIIVDDTGYYAGHCVVFSITHEAFEKMSKHRILETDLDLTAVTDYREQDVPIFHFYDVTADCNENTFYIAGAVLKFFKALQDKDYIVSSLTHRYDSYGLNKHLGLKLIWEDHKEVDALGIETQARFYAGDFKKYLSH